MTIVEPRAKCVAFPEEGIRTIYMAARRCYSSATYEELIEEANGASVEAMTKLVSACIRSGHHSVLEHSAFTFHITCSRATSLQIVRHRIASYSQQSQRYCKFDNIDVVLPDAFDTDDYIEEDIRLLETRYKQRVDGGMKPEDARFGLPECAATQLLLTMNCRTLLNFFEQRTCFRAQKEVRTVANQMLDFCKLSMPAVFGNAGPKCLSLGHCPEHKPCGNSPWRKQS